MCVLERGSERQIDSDRCIRGRESERTYNRVNAIGLPINSLSINRRACLNTHTLKATAATSSLMASVATPRATRLLLRIDSVALRPSVLSIPSFTNQRCPNADSPMKPTAQPLCLGATGVIGGGSQISAAASAFSLAMRSASAFSLATRRRCATCVRVAMARVRGDGKGL